MTLLDAIPTARHRGADELPWVNIGGDSFMKVLQVRVEDQLEAERIFTDLMGDNVEPRRQFIEENAFDVKNLDI